MRAITTTSEHRRSTIMTIVLITVLAIAAAFGLRSLYSIGTAHADTAVVDAGTGSAGSAVVQAAGSGSASYSDPTTDPGGFVSDVVRLWHSGGWAVALLLALVGALEVAAYLGKNVPSLAWLAKGRVSIAIGGGLAIATAALNAAADGGHWSAVLTAVVAAALAFWHQAGTDPAKS